MASEFPNQQSVPSIISQPKASIILKNYGLGLLKPNVFNDIELEATDDFDAKSKFGLPIFDNIIFLQPQFSVPKSDEEKKIEIELNIADPKQTPPETTNALGGNITIGDDKSQRNGERLTDKQQNTFNAFQINTVLIEVTQIRNIITTPIAGQSSFNGKQGTVKEYISDGDYQIRIKGFIESNSPYKHPTVDTGILASYFRAPVPLKVVSNYLRTFDISQLVITNFNFPQTEGRRNLQFFEIDALSDFAPESQFINA